MSQQSYTHLNRAVNRNGDYLPGQRSTRSSPLTGTPTNGNGHDFRPNTSQGLSEFNKSRYTSGGSEDLFLNLANDNLADGSPGRTDDFNAGTSNHLRSVSTSSAPYVFSRRDLTSQSRPLSSTPDDDEYRSRRSLYAPQESSRVTYGNGETARVSSLDYQASPLSNHSRSIHSTYENTERKESEYVRLARQRTPQTFGTPITPVSYQTNSIDDIARSNHASDSHSRVNGDDAASVSSNTAPSTVWDELEELKTRIHSLEKGRPRTNTTTRYDQSDQQRTSTLTSTISQYEPQRTSTMTSRTGGLDFRPETQARARPIPAQTPTTTPQQLLQTAMNSVKPIVSGPVFAALQVHAQGALDLCLSLEDTDDTASILSTSNTATRTLRRRTDNLCRSLTELCIALCGDNPLTTTQSVPQPRHRASTNPLLTNGDTTSSPLIYATSRRNTALDLEPERPASRLSSVEPRRSVVLSRASPRGDPTPSSTRAYPAPRTLSTSTLATRQPLIARTDSPPPSRAHTFTSSSEPPRLSSLSSTSPRHLRESRDYTRSHPMPDPAGASPAAKRAMRLERRSEDDAEDAESTGSGRTERAGARRAEAGAADGSPSRRAPSVASVKTASSRKAVPAPQSQQQQRQVQTSAPLPPAAATTTAQPVTSSSRPSTATARPSVISPSKSPGLLSRWSERLSRSRSEKKA